MTQGCARWRGDIAAFVVGALEPEERFAMRRHLATCLSCRADYQDLLPVGDWLARTKRHLAVCRACRVGYEDLLRPRRAR